jgi:hypothetical protein
VRRREGRRRSKESEALAHGFDGEGSNLPRYWNFSGVESLWIDGGSRERKEGEKEMKSRERKGHCLGAVGALNEWGRGRRGHGIRTGVTVEGLKTILTHGSRPSA